MLIKTALISVHDKTGLKDFAKSLSERGVEILSTGGTLKHMQESGIAAVSISDYTGQPEILDGRVKTLHPKIFGGILARRTLQQDMDTLAEAEIKPIDLVVVSLYPFSRTIAQPGVTIDEAIEQIDIGGVSLIRAAAKNHSHVYVCVDPGDYTALVEVLSSSPDPESQLKYRLDLAHRAMSHTAAYDLAISQYLQKEFERSTDGTSSSGPYPERLMLSFAKLQDLRYGENPHQQAAFYRPASDSADSEPETSVAMARQLHGKELSYNNIIDLDSALEIVRAFDETVCCVIKHNNPCGLARAETLCEAYKAALRGDPVSAFGGVIGLNREVDKDTAAEIGKLFAEAVIAPGFSEEALAILQRKKNVRLLETGPFTPRREQPMLKSVVGGMLVQTRDLGMVDRSELRVVSKVKPTEEDLDALLFAWRAAKFVKSNAIVYASRDATIGVGAGQMSRIDSTNIAAVKAQSPIRGMYMASDAFFPFRDNVDRAKDIGIRAIIQPGGSVRDEEVIAAADEHEMIMVFTGMRHFRH